LELDIKRKVNMPKRMNLAGGVYGELTVLSYVSELADSKVSKYLCKCSCGVEKVVSHGNLRSGHTTSCGCKLHRVGLQRRNTVHGMSKNCKAYKSWCKIKGRCDDPNDISYKNYGLKGINLSDSFRSSFLSFYSEVGDPPSDSKLWSIDRIDNTLGYVEGNIRWATSTQQARNKTMRVDNYSGETGVQFYQTQGTGFATYAVATWRDCVNGKPMNRKFNVRKLGLLPAFKAAVEYRRRMIQELNDQGAGYSIRHGK
jgi:hypothetical protein